MCKKYPLHQGFLLVYILICLTGCAPSNSNKPVSLQEENLHVKPTKDMTIRKIDIKPNSFWVSDERVTDEYLRNQRLYKPGVLPFPKEK